LILHRRADVADGIVWLSRFIVVIIALTFIALITAKLTSIEHDTLETDAKLQESHVIKTLSAIDSVSGELNLGVKGITLTLNPEAANNPRKVRAVLCPEPVLGVVRQLPKLARGEKLDKVYYMTAREMRIEADGPILATVEDGFIAAREFTVTLYKHPLRFVAPF